MGALTHVNGKAVTAALGALAMVYLLVMTALMTNKSNLHIPHGQQFASSFDAIWALQSPYLPPYNLLTQEFVLGDVPIWIDVGANRAAEHGGSKTAVLAFEPQAAYWDQLRRQAPWVYAFPMGVGAADTITAFHVSKNGHSSSLLANNETGVEGLTGQSEGALGYSWDWKGEVEVVKEEYIWTVRLDTLIDKLPTDEIDYLKVDAQGYDLEVVKSAGKFLKKIRKVKLEAKMSGTTGIYEGQPEPEEIAKFMKEQGFEHTATYQSCCLEKVLEVDMMFVNTNTSPSTNANDGSDGRPNIM